MRIPVFASSPTKLNHAQEQSRLRIMRELAPEHSVKATTCPFRKSYPDVLVMQPSQDRNGDNGARSLDCSMQGRIFL
jgi:hypothetical protein